MFSCLFFMVSFFLYSYSLSLMLQLGCQAQETKKMTEKWTILVEKVDFEKKSAFIVFPRQFRKTEFSTIFV
jgi:hypothetical protein